MPAFDLARVTADLQRDEELKLFAYDDATGKAIKPGGFVVGHATIAYGRALDTRGITGPEAALLLADDIPAFDAELVAKLPWVAGLDPVRRGVLLEMSFNLGVGGLSSFKQMLAAVQRGDWAAAEIAMRDSHWFSQVGARAVRLAAKMRTGLDQ